MTASITAYVFRDTRFASGSETVVCVAERAVIEAVLGAGRLQAAFGGGAIYTNDALKMDYLGVWGTRNAARLRTLLRSCGLELAIRRTHPTGARLRYFSHGRHTNGQVRRLAKANLQSLLVSKS